MTLHRKSSPLPRFGSDPKPGKAKSPPSTKAFVPIRVPIHEKNLIQVEFALKLYFLQNKTNSISYRQFCQSLAPRLVLEPPSSVLEAAAPFKSESSSSETVQQRENIRCLSRDDRLWHDLTCILVPQVYDMEASSNARIDASPSTGKAEDNGKATTTLVRRKDSKQQVEFVKELIRKASTRGIDKMLSEEVIRKIHEDKQYLLREKEKRKQQKPIGKDTSKETINATTILASNAIIKPGMTLEQRVRARAAQRDQALQKVSKNEEKDKSIDLVKVADALFSHARLLMRKRKRKLQQNNRLLATSAKPKVESSMCVMLLQDILPAIPNMTRPQISKYIENLSRDYPELIRWKNPNGYRPREEKLCRKATIWLETGDYQNVRTKISGQATNHENQISPAIRRLNFSLPNTSALSGQKRSSDAVGKDNPPAGSKRQSTSTSKPTEQEKKGRS
ncbi:unnamed protein product [Cylindrotheca closterium]|uniref:Uncharacterized protein n=1 Tax=Cylindrotheca closterium TaxID=2856 RepID=A0AAD2CIK4_9STRA|nr:unnamed protein product [Cylindrotheca closterium]